MFPNAIYLVVLPPVTDFKANKSSKGGFLEGLDRSIDVPSNVAKVGDILPSGIFRLIMIWKFDGE